MNKSLTISDKVLLMAISLEFARLIAQLSCRVSNADGFIDDEEDNVQSNCVNLQAMVAMILEIEPDEMHEAFKLTRSGSGMKMAELMTQIRASA
jgi:hypothetical protein